MGGIIISEEKKNYFLKTELMMLVLVYVRVNLGASRSFCFRGKRSSSSHVSDKESSLRIRLSMGKLA